MYQEDWAIKDRVRHLFLLVYAWMTVALLLTAVTAVVLAGNPGWMNALTTSPVLGITLFIVQLVMVVVFAGMLTKLSYTTALGLFIAYSIVSGATLSLIFRAYTFSSITQALAISACMFGSLSLYGFITGADLSKFGSLLRMMLWGFLVSLVINLFWRNSLFDLIISWVGIVLFSALVAYDTAMIKRYALSMEETDSDDYAKVGLYAAFQLYLDFINLFLNMLNVGRRRN